MTNENLTVLKKMAAEIAEREGCFLYDLEVVGQSSSMVVRVFIDKDDSVSGVATADAVAAFTGTATEGADELASGEDSLQVENQGTGASIDDCANVSRGLGLLLDVEDFISESRYELEVSTPGLERSLKEKWHYDRAIGKTIQLSANDELPLPEGLTAKKGPKSLVGVLLSSDDQKIVVESNKNEWVIPRGLIHKAKIKFVFEHPGAKKALGGKKTKKKKR